MVWFKLLQTFINFCNAYVKCDKILKTAYIPMSHAGEAKACIYVDTIVFKYIAKSTYREVIQHSVMSVIQSVHSVMETKTL